MRYAYSSTIFDTYTANNSHLELEKSNDGSVYCDLRCRRHFRRGRPKIDASPPSSACISKSPFFNLKSALGSCPGQLVGGGGGKKKGLPEKNAVLPKFSFFQFSPRRGAGACRGARDVIIIILNY